MPEADISPRSPLLSRAKFLDAFHSQLLVDLTLIGDSVDKHLAAIPAAYEKFDSHAQGLQLAASKATTDFEAMGKALIRLMKVQTDAAQAERIAASAVIAKSTKSSLEVFTRYFWLLIGMSAFNFVALAACLAVFIMGRHM